MSQIAYHASHEQFSPSKLLKLVVLAEEAGFEAIHSSDHFHPWSVRQGQSGFTFSWIAAAMQATKVPFSMVCAPGQRYHPAIVAQAVSTLAEMFPGRINIELGSGEALNEKITGEKWPTKDIRNERLLECFTIIKRLLRGEEVSFKGHVTINEAKIYSLGSTRPLLLCAALSKETAEWAGTWAEGLLTTAGGIEETKAKVDAFRHNGGKGKPVYLQYSFSFGSNEDEALQGAYDQWRTNVLPPDELADMYKPEHFDQKAEMIKLDEIKSKIPMICSISHLYANLEVYKELSIDRISLHNVNTNHEYFIQEFKEHQ